MGDGEQGIKLNVTVPAFGLPEVARPASPAQWYTVVTQGRVERFMPPFASLNDQQRWDVVAYAMTLHTSEEEVAKGKELFEANCVNCSTDFFQDQEKMAALSEVELARMIKQGNDQVPAFAAPFSEEDLWAVTAYLRTLSFDTAPIVSAPQASATPGSLSLTETPSAETPAGTIIGTAAGTEQAPATSAATTVAKEGFGTVSGSVENKTGTDLPVDLKVTLRGYDHGADPSKGPQEVFSQEGSVDEQGSFVFESIEMPLNRIFLAEVTVDGVDLKSGFAIVKEGDTNLTLPPIMLYNKTEDISALVVDETRIFFEYGTDVVQVYNVYSFRNPSDQVIVVKFNENGEVPFLKAPEGSSGFGYEPLQDSEPFQQVENGLAIPPSEGSYGLIAFASVPKAKEYNFSQQFVLPAAKVTVFVPEGITIQSDKSKDLGVQAMQDFNFQIYEIGSMTAGEKLSLSVSGTPKEPETPSASAPADTTSRQNLLIGAGALGVALILAGGWMYLRDRHREEDAIGEEEEGAEFDSSDDVIDAIIALDDLHRARKISQEAYQKRRAELKDILKGMM
jgi:mono/diheme cytochrome c family protein